MEMPAKRYLGDSVYVEVHSGGLKLTTSNGEGDVDTIYLEVEVYAALVQFYEDAARAVRYAQAIAIATAAKEEH